MIIRCGARVPGGRVQHGRWWLPAIAVVAGFLVQACGRAPAADVGTSEPARLESIESSDLKRVILTERAAERIGIQTAPVRDEHTVRRRRIGGEVVDLSRLPAGVQVALAQAAVAGNVGMWVRVPLSPGELGRADRTQTATVLPLAAQSGGAAVGSVGVLASRPAEVDSALYYPLDGQTNGLAPGQRVLVQVPLTTGQRKVVPFSAVLYDTRGSTWVYTRAESLAFVRQPVSIDFVDGDHAFLLEGPPAGAEVVTVGATELFGTEFKFNK